MKLLKRILGTLLALIVIILALAFALPNDYGVSRSIVINAPAEKIYPMIATTKEWQKWSVWNQRDPSMVMTFTGPEAGKDAAWDWQSKSQGNGGMKFTNVVANQQIDYELHFEGMGKPSTGSFIFEPQGKATKITWTMKGTSEGSVSTKLFVPFMDKLIGPDFEAGLNNLKKLVE